ncbi:MAG: thiamine diphosphokinase, partial [Fimbriimonas ginsengisoli]|nr:thiamine diphosphokinase [Fimbriimonas ginsengisoli]
IAADGGANRLYEAGHGVQVVVGDFDSAISTLAGGPHEVVSDPDESRTDCDKLLAYVAAEGFPSVTLIGVEGDLPDHVLASLHSAAASKLAVRIAFRRGLGWIVRSGDTLEVACEPGTRVSLLPLERCEGVVLRGVRWELRDASLAPQGTKSISNQSMGERVSVEIGEGVALLFVETPIDAPPTWD